MAEFPALPIFTDAYLGDTRHLTTAQHGAYFLLLLIAWRTADCSLPDDDVFLSRCVGMDRRTWVANKATVLAFWFRNSDGRWQQKRLLDERNFAEQVRSKNSAAGKASALKRLNRGSTSAQPDANETSTPSPTPLPKEKKEVTPLPPWVPVADWNAFKEMRRKKRAPLTPTAEQLAITQLDTPRRDGHDPKAVLQQSIFHSWSGLFALKTNSTKGPQHGSQSGFAKQDYRSGTEGFDVT